MAFVVETGEGLTNSNSYVSVAEWTTYFTDRNNATALAYTDTEVQGALIYATEWLDDNVQWYSTIVSLTQALGWPRSQYYDSEWRTVADDEVPVKVKNATIELALQHLTENLNSTEGEGITSESYGDASINYKSTGGSSSKSYTFIKDMLKDYAMFGGGSVAQLFRG